MANSRTIQRMTINSSIWLNRQRDREFKNLSIILKWLINYSLQRGFQLTEQGTKYFHKKCYHKDEMTVRFIVEPFKTVRASDIEDMISLFDPTFEKTPFIEREYKLYINGIK